MTWLLFSRNRSVPSATEKLRVLGRRPAPRPLLPALDHRTVTPFRTGAGRRGPGWVESAPQGPAGTGQDWALWPTLTLGLPTPCRRRPGPRAWRVPSGTVRLGRGGQVLSLPPAHPHTLTFAHPTLTHSARPRGLWPGRLVSEDGLRPPGTGASPLGSSKGQGWSSGGQGWPVVARVWARPPPSPVRSQRNASTQTQGLDARPLRPQGLQGGSMPARRARGGSGWFWPRLPQGSQEARPGCGLS